MLPRRLRARQVHAHHRPRWGQMPPSLSEATARGSSPFDDGPGFLASQARSLDHVSTRPWTAPRTFPRATRRMTRRVNRQIPTAVPTTGLCFPHRRTPSRAEPRRLRRYTRSASPLSDHRHPRRAACAEPKRQNATTNALRAEDAYTSTPPACTTPTSTRHHTRR